MESPQKHSPYVQISPMKSTAFSVPRDETHEIYMRCVTWSKDSHGLFDYESRHISKKNIKAVDAGKVVRIDNEIEFV